jgi:hypothetical protein
MKPRLPTALSAIVMALSFCMTTLLLAPSIAMAQEAFVIKPVADKKLKELPPGPLYWRVENFRTLTQARAAEGPASLSAEVAGKAWLFTLGTVGGSTPGGTKVAEVGPVPPVTAPEYLLRITNSGGPPGAKTPVHAHPGAEAFYVLTGRMGQKTPHGVTYTEAGQSMNGHGADMPMEVFNAGTTDLDQLVMFVVDATRPFAVPASFH